MKFIKHVLNVITKVAKEKTLALRHKTGVLKTRLMIFSVLKNRKLLMSSISSKLQALMGRNGEIDDQSKDIVIYNALKTNSIPNPADMGEYLDEDDKERYPDMTHSLFDLEDDFNDPGGSVIDIKHSKEDDGEEFRLEDEIDQVADLFIKRFHLQMRMQKQLSLKRYKEVLQSGNELY